jgi:protein-S-isoprenylcysteine O-methyltransferase Ste14
MTGRILLVLQLLILVLLAWPWAELQRAGLAWAGLGLVVIGAALGLWALAANRPGNFNLVPEVKQTAQFISGGPYAWVRHPMYLALMVAGLGVVLLYHDWPKLLCWVALLLVLRAKSALEEKAMSLRFPGYRDYAAMTGRFLPKVMLG